jgi:hypothetical protein
MERVLTVSQEVTYCIQHLLRYFNRHENRNPITRNGASNPVISRDGILGQPRVDGLHATPIWPDELRDLFLHEMLSIPCVFRIAYLVQLAFKLGKARLGEGDAKPDELRGRGRTEVDPTGRRQYGIFQLWGVSARRGSWHS